MSIKEAPDGCDVADASGVSASSSPGLGVKIILVMFLLVLTTDADIDTIYGSWRDLWSLRWLGCGTE